MRANTTQVLLGLLHRLHLPLQPRNRTCCLVMRLGRHDFQTQEPRVEAWLLKKFPLLHGLHSFTQGCAILNPSSPQKQKKPSGT